MSASFSRLQVQQAWALIVACQIDLGYKLTDGQRRDLLKDNCPWPSDVCDAIVAHVATVPCRANDREPPAAMSVGNHIERYEDIDINEAELSPDDERLAEGLRR